MMQMTLEDIGEILDNKLKTGQLSEYNYEQAKQHMACLCLYAQLPPSQYSIVRQREKGLTKGIPFCYNSK